MKYDINLLQKRKAVQYSGKKLGTVLIFILLFAALLYAGIALPSNMLASAQIRLANLDTELVSQPAVDQEQAEKTLQNAMLQQAVKQLEDLNDSKTAATHYIEALETSLPTSAYIDGITMADNRMTINGVVPRDEVLATFALRLRETGLFLDVYVNSSAVENDGVTTRFMLIATLPKPLGTSPEVIDGSDKADEDSTTKQPAATPAAENTEAANDNV